MLSGNQAAVGSLASGIQKSYLAYLARRAVAILTLLFADIFRFQKPHD